MTCFDCIDRGGSTLVSGRATVSEKGLQKLKKIRYDICCNSSGITMIAVNQHLLCLLSKDM